MNTIPPPPPQPQRSHTGKWIGIGCGSLLALLVLGGFIAYALVKTLVVGLMEQYTDTQPRDLPQLSMPETQAREVCVRVNAFQAALKDGKASEPLLLSGDDINALIKYHPSWSKAASNVYVSVENTKIRGEVSIPLDTISSKAKGRYLNGSGMISVQLMDGRLLIFLDKLEVKGEELPEEFMKAFRSENLAKNANEDKKTAESLARLESITVRDGQIRVVPKQAP